jgi:AraC-like DNA-binding protein
MKLVFSSKEYPSAKRFEAWRAGVCDHYVKVDMVDMGPSDYVGYIKEASFGPVTLTETQSPPLHIVRRRSHLSRVGKDCIYVCFAAKSSLAVQQRNQNILCTVGKAGLFTASEPYELKNTDPALFIYLEFPRAEFAKRFSGKTPPVTSLIQTGFGIGRVAAAICSSMAMEAPNLQADARIELGNDIMNILALAFEPTEHDAAESLGDWDVRGARLRQVMTYIEKNLGNPLLNPDRVAKANQMSVRSLQYLFKSADISVSDFIWTSRLERCRRELELAVGQQRTVTEIAMNAGFNSLSHFSNVFRERYGVSPTRIRDP